MSNTRRRRYAFTEENTTNNTTDIIGNINKGIKSFFSTNKTLKNTKNSKNTIKTVKTPIYSKLNFKTRFIDFGYVYSKDFDMFDIDKYKYDYFIWPFETRFIYDINYNTLLSSNFYRKYHSFQNTLNDFYRKGEYNRYNFIPYYNILRILYIDYDIDDAEMNKWYKNITNKINSKYLDLNERRLFYAKITDVYSLGITLAGKYASITNHILDDNWSILNINTFKNETDKDNNMLFLKKVSVPFYKLIRKMVTINPLKRINITDAKNMFIKIISGLTSETSRKNLGQRGGQKGGIKIGEGGFGCVYRPQIPCDGKTVQPGYVTKVIDKVEAIKELNECNKIKDIDPQNKYFVYPLKMCKITSQVIPNIRDCSLYTSNSVLLQLPDGGQTLQDIKIKKDEIIDFLRSWLSLFYGLELLHNNGMAHMDIKTINTVSKLENKNTGSSSPSYGFTDEIALSSEAYIQLNALMKTPNNSNSNSNSNSFNSNTVYNYNSNK